MESVMRTETVSVTQASAEATGPEVRAPRALRLLLVHAAIMSVHIMSQLVFPAAATVRAKKVVAYVTAVPLLEVGTVQIARCASAGSLVSSARPSARVGHA
jgi:hypothetical protein